MTTIMNMIVEIFSGFEFRRCTGDTADVDVRVAGIAIGSRIVETGGIDKKMDRVEVIW